MRFRLALAVAVLASPVLASPALAAQPLAAADSIRVERVLDGIQVDRQTASAIVRMAGSDAGRWVTAGVFAGFRDAYVPPLVDALAETMGAAAPPPQPRTGIDDD